MRFKPNSVLVGADPELFMRNPNSGAFVSAHDCGIPGTKYMPFPVKDGALQIDGTALEFNIDPARTRDEFNANVRSVLSTLKTFVPEYNVEAVPVADFEPSYFDSLPPEALELGCDPDFSAWTGFANPRPPGDATKFRTGSGHIHIGFKHVRNVYHHAHFKQCMALGRQLDYYVGVQSLKWDSEPRRRILYGSAGAFRPKNYGLEYRVLSNAWVGNENIQSFVYDASVRAVRDYFRGKRATDVFGQTAAEMINNGTLEGVEQIEQFTEMRYNDAA